MNVPKYLYSSGMRKTWVSSGRSDKKIEYKNKSRKPKTIL